MTVSKTLIVNLDPSTADIESAVKEIKKASHVLFFCYDAHLSQNAKKLLETVQASGKAAVILLRNPYDEEWIQEETVCVTAYGFRAVQIRAAVKQIQKGLRTAKVS